ncbi:MAG: ATP-binding protein [Chloroflexota bacterium]|nr:ATP-binding protein [Chloroflexota bacterium]
MTKVHRPSSAATSAQTRAYAMRPDVLASQLRAEIATVPATPHGRPALIVFMGLPGVGKSHCARLLCGRLGAAHVASDELRSRLFIAASYAEEENRAVFAAATALIASLLDEGHRVVVDATNLIARNRAGTIEAARRRGISVTYVRITAPDDEARARLASRRAGRAPGDHSEADEPIYERMRAETFEPPAEGFIELVNGPRLAEELERIVAAVERTS